MLLFVMFRINWIYYGLAHNFFPKVGFSPYKKFYGRKSLFCFVVFMDTTLLFSNLLVLLCGCLIYFGQKRWPFLDLKIWDKIQCVAFYFVPALLLPLQFFFFIFYFLLINLFSYSMFLVAIPSSGTFLLIEPSLGRPRPHIGLSLATFKSAAIYISRNGYTIFKFPKLNCGWSFGHIPSHRWSEKVPRPETANLVEVDLSSSTPHQLTIVCRFRSAGLADPSADAEPLVSGWWPDHPHIA